MFLLFYIFVSFFYISVYVSDIDKPFAIIFVFVNGLLGFWVYYLLKPKQIVTANECGRACTAWAWAMYIIFGVAIARNNAVNDTAEEILFLYLLYLLGILVFIYPICFIYGFIKNTAKTVFTKKISLKNNSADYHKQPFKELSSSDKDLDIPASKLPHKKHYEKALSELSSGERDEGIWAMAYAESVDKAGAKKLYVKLRAADLKKRMWG
jgi:hypothetical protein